MSRSVVRTQPAGDTPGFIDVLDDGSRAYFVRPAGDAVEVVDLATLQIVDTITVEPGPSVVALCHVYRRE